MGDSDQPDEEKLLEWEELEPEQRRIFGTPEKITDQDKHEIMRTIRKMSKKCRKEALDVLNSKLNTILANGMSKGSTKEYMEITRRIRDIRNALGYLHADSKSIIKGPGGKPIEKDLV